MEQDIQIIGLDNINDYFDIQLKEDRLAILKEYKDFDFKKIDLSMKTDVDEVFEQEKPTHVIHLAAQAGVRYSIENPQA